MPFETFPTVGPYSPAELTTDLNTNFTDAQTQLNALDTRLDAAEPQLVSLDGRLDTAEATITSLDGRLDVVEPELVSLDGRLDTAETTLISLDTRVDVLEAANTTMDKARAYLNTAQNSASAAWGKVNIDTVSYDTNSIWNAANKRFIPKKAGYYLCSVRARTNTTGGMAIAIGFNGAQTVIVGSDTASLVGFAVGGTGMIYANGTTDYLEMFVYATSARAYTTGVPDTYMEVLGPF